MGWGSSTRRSGGRELGSLPRKFSLGFDGGNFAGMSRTRGGVKSLCKKKVHAHFSLPIHSPKEHRP